MMGEAIVVAKTIVAVTTGFICPVPKLLSVACMACGNKGVGGWRGLIDEGNVAPPLKLGQSSRRTFV